MASRSTLLLFKASHIRPAEGTGSRNTGREASEREEGADAYFPALCSKRGGAFTRPEGDGLLWPT